MSLTKNGRSHLLGLFGGTFDPIHYGHLGIAQYLLTHLPLEEIHFVPCLAPPHRPAPQASPEHRLAMLQLAISNCDHWIVNKIDFQRPGPSYMIDTLTLLHQIYPTAHWCLILGMDAFANFNHWHQWKKILTLAHLIVINRPDFEIPHAKWSKHLLAEVQVESANDLVYSPAGKIIFQTVPPIPISATQIRYQIAHNDQNSLSLPLPSEIVAYIKQHHLYQER